MPRPDVLGCRWDPGRDSTGSGTRSSEGDERGGEAMELSPRTGLALV